MQRIATRMGPKKLKTQEEQLEDVTQLRQDMQDHINRGNVMLFIDECCFSPNRYAPYAWAPKKRPHVAQTKWQPQKLICVLGAISPIHGVVHHVFETTK